MCVEAWNLNNIDTVLFADKVAKPVTAVCIPDERSCMLTCNVEGELCEFMGDGDWNYGLVAALPFLVDDWELAVELGLVSGSGRTECHSWGSSGSGPPRFDIGYVWNESYTRFGLSLASGF